MKSKEISLVAIFASLYAVTAIIPISTFIGAPSFLGLNLIITPIIALMLSPINALLSSLIGGIIGLYIAPSQAMFGFFSILLPMVGAFFGSLTYHSEDNSSKRLWVAVFLGMAIAAYTRRNSDFMFFIVPHSIALFAIFILPYIRSNKLRVPISIFVSTMCEQGMMMILAVYLLGLPALVFKSILPLMLYERIISTIGASFVVLSIYRVLTEK